MTPEQRVGLIRLLQQGEDISPEWARLLCSLLKREEANFRAADGYRSQS